MVSAVVSFGGNHLISCCAGSPQQGVGKAQSSLVQIVLLFPQTIPILLVSLFKHLLACAKFPKSLVLLKIILSKPRLHLFPQMQSLIYVWEAGVLQAKSLYLLLVGGRWTFGSAQSLPPFIPCFHFHTARNATDVPDKWKLHF